MRTCLPLTHLRLSHFNQPINQPTNPLHGHRSTYPNHDATYLLWVDTAGLAPYLPKGGDPASFFMEHAKVAVSDGRDFGAHHHVRINFGEFRGVEIGESRRGKGLN